MSDTQDHHDHLANLVRILRSDYDDGRLNDAALSFLEDAEEELSKARADADAEFALRMLTDHLVRAYSPDLWDDEARLALSDGYEIVFGRTAFAKEDEDEGDEDGPTTRP